jgi:hypothetical protein
MLLRISGRERTPQTRTYRCRTPRGRRGRHARKECAAKARNHSRVASALPHSEGIAALSSLRPPLARPPFAGLLFNKLSQTQPSVGFGLVECFDFRIDGLLRTCGTFRPWVRHHSGVGRLTAPALSPNERSPLRLGKTLLELGVLVFQGLQVLGIRDFKATVPGLPFVEYGAANPVPAGGVLGVKLPPGSISRGSL